MEGGGAEVTMHTLLHVVYTLVCIGEISSTRMISLLSLWSASDRKERLMHYSFRPVASVSAGMDAPVALHTHMTERSFCLLSAAVEPHRVRRM